MERRLVIFVLLTWSGCSADYSFTQELQDCSCSCSCDLDQQTCEPAVEVTTPPPDIPTTTTSCPCYDLVFMLDASNSLNFPSFNETIMFTKNVMSKLDVGEDCTHVGLISFSGAVHVKVDLGETSDEATLADKADHLVFDAGVTATHKVIDEFVSQIQNNGRDSCTTVGVLVTDGRADSWPDLMVSLVNMYDALDEVKLIVVAIHNPATYGRDDELAIEQVKATATGTGNENLVIKGNFADLTDEVAVEVVDMIMKPNGPQGCTQMAITSFSSVEVVGAFEPDGIQCYGTRYVSTNTFTTLAKTDGGGSYQPFWALFSNIPSDTCAMSGVLAGDSAYNDPALPDRATPNLVPDWDSALGSLGPIVVCYN